MFAPVLFAGGIWFCPGSQWGFFNTSFNLEVMLREVQRSIGIAERGQADHRTLRPWE